MENFYTSLDYQDLLEVSGEGSKKFLQGQVTCDLDNFENHQYGLGALCNNKGRVYSSFRILKNDDAFIMAMQPGVMGITESTLKKYIPFYKASIADAGTRFHRAGLCGPLAQKYIAGLLPEVPGPGQSVKNGEEFVINLGGNTPRFEIWSLSSIRMATLLKNSGLPEQPNNAYWQVFDLEAGLFFIGPEDVERYTPEEASLDLGGFVSFDKGCYTGQEIVARMHYRGKAGKRLHIITIDSAASLSDKTLKDTSGKALGVLTNLLYINDKIKAFSVLKTAEDYTGALTMEGLEAGSTLLVASPDFSSASQ